MANRNCSTLIWLHFKKGLMFLLQKKCAVECLPEFGEAKMAEAVSGNRGERFIVLPSRGRRLGAGRIDGEE